ncbi:MAG TPA: lytic transglycosylase domain-containing protein [Luteitalea sp.]|nr:lytic transglycosylase domain-containing protein [Luteitalea sp.]
MTTSRRVPLLRARRATVWVATAGLAVGLATMFATGARSTRVSLTPQAAQRLAPTAHPPVPSSIDEAWLVGTNADRQKIAQRPGVRALRAASQAARANRYADVTAALQDVSLAGTPLEPYAEYYAGLADLRQRRAAPARTRLRALRSSLSAGRLRQLALSAEAEAALSLGDAAAAASLLEELYPSLTGNRDVVLDQWATAVRAAGRADDAVKLWLRLYYEFPTSELALPALRQAETTLQAAAVGTPDSFNRDMTRAEALLAAGRTADADAALARLETGLAGSRDAAEAQARRDRVQLRRAQAACTLGRCAAAVTPLTDLADRKVGSGEADYLLATALRQLGRADDYRLVIDRLAAVAPGGPSDPWVERTLNEYGTHLIKTGNDTEAASLFRTLFDRNAGGRYGERAAWKYGWWAYRQGQFAETTRVFDTAAASIPRANTRPAWLYWSGRARERMGERDGATRRLTLAAVDYLHSYYGRLASEALTRLGAPLPTTTDAPVTDLVVSTALDSGGAEPDGPADVASDVALGDTGTLAARDLPPTSEMISWLVSAGLYDEAIAEMRHAQRAHGRSARLDATLAWVYRAQGENRPAINTMRQAYPQYLSVQGDALPREIQEVIFPIDYVPLIKRYSAEHHLDPFIVAALIGQESSYVADVRSPANAWGLMQILPSTGARLARVDGVRRFRTTMLTDPETNVRLGTRHFARLVQQLGGVPFALAGYNAGENRVIRWKAERGPLEQAEFIDDIPYPETQMYVKKILGTAVDYRRLYGDRLGE